MEIIPNTGTKPLPANFSRYQKFVVALLAFTQFTIVLDFMIMSPLGAIMMPALKMSTSQFGLVVSMYAFSAGVSGLLAAGFADKFDRKKLLLLFYLGFILGTFLCGIAPDYKFLLVARMITGLFGGVIGAVSMAITTDLFPLSMRGRVMGIIQTSFASSQILGIPIGLYISTRWGWHMSFMMIVAFSTVAATIIFLKLKPIDEHLKIKSDRNAVMHLWNTLKNTHFLNAFAVTALMSIGGFMLMPFASAFTVNNLGINVEKLPLIYLITGLFAIFIGPIVGKASDSVGKLKVFLFGAALTIVTVIFYTNLSVSPLWLVITTNVVLFCAIFSRIIPAQAMMSAIPAPGERGAFMAVSSSLQQISGGVASVIAGSIVAVGPGGLLLHFDSLGYILTGTVLVSAYMMIRISREIEVRSKLG